MNKETRETYQRIVCLNAEGISSMRQSKYLEAIGILREAMEELLAAFSDEPSAQNIAPSTSIFYSGCTAKREGGRTLGSSTVFDESVAFAQDDDVFSLFKRALHLENFENAVQCPSFYCRLMSAVLLYNTALATHLLGLWTGNSALLSSALDYYSMSYTSLSHQSTLMREDSSILDLGFLALANNMGHLFAFFRNLPRADVCRRELGRLLSSLLMADQSRGTSNVSLDEFNTFYLNVCCVQEIDVLCAPAAWETSVVSNLVKVSHLKKKKTVLLACQ